MEMVNTFIWYGNRNSIRIVSHLENGNEEEERKMCVVREGDDSAAICVYVTNTSTAKCVVICSIIIILRKMIFSKQIFIICLMYRNSLPSSSLCRFEAIANNITYTNTYECAMNSPVHIKAKRRLEQIVLRS